MACFTYDIIFTNRQEARQANAKLPKHCQGLAGGRKSLPPHSTQAGPSAGRRARSSGGTRRNVSWEHMMAVAPAGGAVLGKYIVVYRVRREDSRSTVHGTYASERRRNQGPWGSSGRLGRWPCSPLGRPRTMAGGRKVPPLHAVASASQQKSAKAVSYDKEERGQGWRCYELDQHLRISGTARRQKSGGGDPKGRLCTFHPSRTLSQAVERT